VIGRKTVLVLGAGASAPYDFPTGQKLLEQVVETARNPPSGILGFGMAKLAELADALEGWRSVDWFLERRSDRRDFTEMGKQLMAYRLLVHERDETLSNAAPEEDWYSYLLDPDLMETRRGKFGENKLSVVTFNYDRSLERFFFLRLKQLYGLNEFDGVAEASKIEVVHVHGSLGDREFRDVPYNVTDPRSDLVQRASANIRIISEAAGPEPTPQFSRAHELLESAEAICFLGFGFHPENIARLGLAKLVEGRAAGYWFATHKDLTPVEFARRTKTIGGAFSTRIVDAGSLFALRHLPVFP
jgi:hypothetical protein